MKDITLTIQINKPLSEVFAFAINPKNTPLYVESIVAEQTNEWPVKIGTIYRNKKENSEWSEYEVTAFQENELFTLKKSDGSLVRYKFKSLDTTKTELEYYVSTENDELDESFIRSIVEKFKSMVEK